MQLTTPLIGQAPSQAYDLKHGELWEQVLCEHLCQHGLNAYRPKQRFQAMRSRGHHWSYTDPALLRPYQIDVVVRAGRRRYNLEVKALTGAAFYAKMCHFGRVEKWDAKRMLGEQPVTINDYKAGATPAVPVHAIALINSHTGEVWLCPADKKEWAVAPAFYGNAMDYAISPNALAPFSEWVDDILSVGA